MIRLSLLLLILTVNSYGQKPADTLCLPTENVRGLVIAAKQGDALKQQVVILNDRIGLLQSIVKELELKDSASKSGYTAQIAALLEEKKIYQDQLNTYEKLLKRERRKRRLATAGGIVTTGLAIYLGFVK